MWSYYWDEITDRITKYFSDVLLSYQKEIEFCYRGSKIWDLIRNLQQNHSSFCDTINMCTINLFVFSNLVPRVSWLSNREEGSFLDIKKPAYPGNEVVYLVTVYSILGPLLFNIFFADLFLIHSDTDSANFADDNTPYLSAENVEDATESLERSSVSLFRWFENNLLNSNADKYHFLVSTNQEISLNVNNFKIKKTETAKNF